MLTFCAPRSELTTLNIPSLYVAKRWEPDRVQIGATFAPIVLGSFLARSQVQQILHPNLPSLNLPPITDSQKTLKKSPIKPHHHPRVMLERLRIFLIERHPLMPDNDLLSSPNRPRLELRKQRLLAPLQPRSRNAIPRQHIPAKVKHKA